MFSIIVLLAFGGILLLVSSYYICFKKPLSDLSIMGFLLLLFFGGLMFYEGAVKVDEMSAIQSEDVR